MILGVGQGAQLSGQPSEARLAHEFSRERVHICNVYSVLECRLKSWPTEPLSSCGEVMVSRAAKH